MIKKVIEVDLEKPRYWTRISSQTKSTFVKIKNFQENIYTVY